MSFGFILFTHHGRQSLGNPVDHLRVNEYTLPKQSRFMSTRPKFRTAEGRVHRAMLESGARVPPHCLEAVHSRFRAAQVVPWRHAYSNRLLVGDDAHGPPAGSPHFLSSLIERSLS